jgi:hypothetical protein
LFSLILLHPTMSLLLGWHGVVQGLHGTAQSHQTQNCTGYFRPQDQLYLLSALCFLSKELSSPVQSLDQAIITDTHHPWKLYYKPSCSFLNHSGVRTG